MKKVMQIIESKGLLFIGDPHISSRSPQRRRDDYTQAILIKLKEAIDLASKNDWIPIIMGDLFDRPRDTEPSMLSQLLMTLIKSKHKPIILVGNHDIVARTLTHDTALNVIASSGCAHVVHDAGVIALIRTPDAPNGLLVYGVPYGAALPSALDDRKGVDHVVMLTHHDLAISGASYPGSFEPLEINGVDMVINGHDHTLKAWQDVGMTRYCNIGNIARLSVAQLYHEPAVFSWTGKNRELIRHVLGFKREVFDMTGYNVAASEVDDPTRNMPLATRQVSQFVAMLKGSNENHTDSKISDDAVDIKIDVDDILDAMHAKKSLPQGLRNLIEYILKSAKEDSSKENNSGTKID